MSSERRGSRLYRDIKSGFEATGCPDDEEDDAEGCGVGNNRRYGESTGAFSSASQLLEELQVGVNFGTECY